MNLCAQRAFVCLVAIGGSHLVALVSAQTPDAPGRNMEEYRRSAMAREGDTSRGKELFSRGEAVACSICHSVDGKGGKLGPDLYAVGDRFGRIELIRSVLFPSEMIAVGYSMTTVTTKSGIGHVGIIKQATDA